MLRKIKHYVKRTEDFIRYPAETMGISKLWMQIDGFIACAIYGCSISEYYLYHFYKLNRFGRREFINFRTWKRILASYNPKSAQERLENKENFAMEFDAFFRREWIAPNYHSTPDEVDQFCKNHKRCIVKPLGECGGHGIQLVDLAHVDPNTFMKS